MYVPLGYYNDANGLTGEDLKDILNHIITNHTEYIYTGTSTDVWDILREADEDPENSDNVIMFYSGFSWPKECQDTNTDLLPDYCFENDDREADYLEWNREHIWSKSHGEFDHEGSSSYAYGEWFFEPRDEVKGDVARMLFYMAVRYEGEDGDYVDLELVEDLKALAPELHIQDSKLPYYGDLTILLRWHLEDPVDEAELERNEVIYQYQGNRNPFIDPPEYVD